MSERRPPGRGAWLRSVERLAPGAVDLARKITASPARPGQAVNLADLDPEDARQLALLRRLGAVHVYPSGDLARRHAKTHNSRDFGVDLARIVS